MLEHSIDTPLCQCVVFISRTLRRMVLSSCFSTSRARVYACVCARVQGVWPSPMTSQPGRPDSGSIHAPSHQSRTSPLTTGAARRVRPTTDLDIYTYPPAALSFQTRTAEIKPGRGENLNFYTFSALLLRPDSAAKPRDRSCQSLTDCSARACPYWFFHFLHPAACSVE